MCPKNLSILNMRLRGLYEGCKKYRYKVLSKDVTVRIRNIIRQICDSEWSSRDTIYIFAVYCNSGIILPMVRIARVICLGTLHHITQRGNRRQQTFFNDENYLAYIELMP